MALFIAFSVCRLEEHVLDLFKNDGVLRAGTLKKVHQFVSTLMASTSGDDHKEVIKQFKVGTPPTSFLSVRLITFSSTF